MSQQNRGGSRAAATSKMECFVIIVNGWKPLTIIIKHSILDVAAALDPPLQNMPNPSNPQNRWPRTPNHVPNRANVDMCSISYFVIRFFASFYFVLKAF